jgi:S-(hydroxymethyl)glutathione dehydrogenase / alcohol dehydrogenase
MHPGDDQLTIEDVLIDEPGPGEVLVATRATGLCHSDLRFVRGDASLAGPTILGHEGSGVVEAIGPGVTAVAVGDHVVGFSRGACGSCSWCRSGRPVHCPQDQHLRSDDAPPRIRFQDGRPISQFVGLSTFAELMLVHENALVTVDPTVPFDVAALVGCAVPAGVGAVVRTAQVAEGETVAVIGCGGVGLNVIQGAVLAGAARVIAIDLSPGKLELAERFGATDLVKADGDVLAAVDRVLAGAGGVDHAFEVVGSSATYELAFGLLRRGGTATVIGVTDDSVTLPCRAFLQERRIQGASMGSVDFRRDIPWFLELWREGRLELEALVSRRIPLDQIGDGYRRIADGDVARSVVVFDP